MSKSIKTKELIYNTALKVIREKGTLTLKEISTLANVNIAAINYYFDDKETLIKELISGQLNEAKSQISAFIDNLESPAEYVETLPKIIAYLYDFALENIGILNYIFASGNEQIVEQSIYLYLHNISLDKAFMDRIMQFINKLHPTLTHSEFKTKYTQLVSTFAFPLIFQLKLTTINVASFYNIADKDFREAYIRQICKTFFQE